MRSAMLTISLVGIVFGLFAVGAASADERVSVTRVREVSVPPIVYDPAVKRPLVQMAILLDTSGSMSGLIDQARAELWAIVNEFIFAKRGGVAPEVQVALYEYGKMSLPPEGGYIRRIVPLTTDLDKISEELFALKTNGGDEYCGWVIKEATAKLEWSTSGDDLKVIFIAGNEPFTQGPVDYKESCKAAIGKNIIVNTIHCGSESEGLNGKWKDGALLADGRYLNIDQNRQIVHIAAPQDKKISELSIRLNETYIAYGVAGSNNYARQSAQDRNAANLSPEASIQRSVAKSSANYRNEYWDLVDAYAEDNGKLIELKEEELPENMRKMSDKEKKEYVEAKAKERAEIQKKIQGLNEQRKKYVAAEMKKQEAAGEKTLGSAVIQAVREQAKTKKFKFEQPKEPKNEAKNDAPAAEPGS
ncbi:MAG: VWA domain-containing protein [Sedimentisphaerales bacterium]|nr:VWA domain-containing protein [Sedimentisphaerales bacterium]